jgi:hypothetical protein
LLAHGRWLSLGTPASSTTTTGRHDISEIFAESGVKTPTTPPPKKKINSKNKNLFLV